MASSLTNLMTGIVIMGVVGIVGLYIMNEVDSVAQVGYTCDENGTNCTYDTYYNASTKVDSIVNTGFGLMLIAVLALIAGVIISYLTGGLGGSKSGL